MLWSLAADDYIKNIDPEQDPMRGARVSASYVEAVSSLGETVQDSEDEDEPAQQQGHCSSSALHRLYRCSLFAASLGSGLCSAACIMLPAGSVLQQ